MTNDDLSNETKQAARKHPRSQEAVHDSEEWLFTTLESIGDAVIVTDVEGRIIFMNKVAVELTGWSATEAEGREHREVFQIVQEATRQETESPVMKVLRDGVPSALVNHDTLLIAKDGTERCIEESGAPNRNKEGELVGVVLIFRDVTERRTTQKALTVETALQEQTAILQTLFDYIPMIVAFLDQTGQFQWVNREWARVTGWTLEAMQGHEMMMEFYPDPTRREAAIDYLHLAAPGWREFYTTVHDGSVLNISWASVRLSDGTGLGIGQVVTEHKQEDAAVNQTHATMKARNARLELAMRETTHRFKNNLQMISALVELHASEDGESVPVEQLAQLRLHIQSLGAIHDLLLEDAKRDALVGDVSAKEALLQLVPLLQKTAGAQQIDCTADEVRLPIKQGMSLAVLVNELVSNAVKHGGKHIGLRLMLAGGEVTLEVADDGPGFTVEFDPKKGNTGMELVESLSRLDLGGSVTFSNRPEGGGRVQVTFPTPALKVA